MPEAGGLVGDGEDHEQLMHALGCSPSGRSPGSGSGSAPPWPPRPANRAAISAAARLTDTGSLTRVRTRTRPTPRGPPRAPARARPGRRAGRGVDVRPAAGRAQRRADHPGAERRIPCLVGCWPEAEPAPDSGGTARRLGHLQASRAPGAGQRCRFH